MNTAFAMYGNGSYAGADMFSSRMQGLSRIESLGVQEVLEQQRPRSSVQEAADVFESIVVEVINQIAKQRREEQIRRESEMKRASSPKPSTDPPRRSTTPAPARRDTSPAPAPKRTGPSARYKSCRREDDQIIAQMEGLNQRMANAATDPNSADIDQLNRDINELNRLVDRLSSLNCSQYR